MVVKTHTIRSPLLCELQCVVYCLVMQLWPHFGGKINRTTPLQNINIKLTHKRAGRAETHGNRTQCACARIKGERSQFWTVAPNPISIFSKEFLRCRLDTWLFGIRASFLSYIYKRKHSFLCTQLFVPYNIINSYIWMHAWTKLLIQHKCKSKTLFLLNLTG